MPNRNTLIIVSVFFISLIPYMVSAAVRPMSHQEVFSKAEFVLKGEVIGKTTRWGDNHKMIWTDYQIKVLENILAIDKKEVVMSFAGGEVDSESIFVTEVPRLEVGGIYILAGYHNQHLYSAPIIGGTQGVYRMLYGDTSNTEVLVDYSGNRVDISTNSQLLTGPKVSVDQGKLVFTKRETSSPSRQNTDSTLWIVKDTFGREIPQPPSQKLLEEPQLPDTNRAIGVNEFIDLIKSYRQ